MQEEVKIVLQLDEKEALKPQPPTKTKAQQNKNDIQNQVGQAQDNPDVKDLVGKRTKKATQQALNSGITTRSSGYSLRSKK